MAPVNGEIYDSPSRQLLHEAQGRNDESPRRLPDSPSLQLLLELRDQNAAYDRELRARLDQQTLEQEKLHIKALAAAQAEHDRIRESAERAQLRIELEQEKEKIQREEDEKQALDRERQEKIEREIASRKRDFENQKRLEAQRREAEKAEADARARAEADERSRLEREKEEQDRARREAEQREAEEQQRKQEAATRKVEQTTPAVQPPALASPTTVAPSVDPSSSNTSVDLVTPMSSRDATHQQFLNIHQQLKDMRKFVVEQSKQNPEVKKRLGEMRREIRKCVGQLTAEKGANRIPISRIRAILQDAKSLQQPSVDARKFILSQESNGDASQAQVSALFVYLINIFAKAVISQFIDEAGVAPKAADPIGVVAISIFAAAEFQWQGSSFIDVLLAKYHKVCPVLFGIYGSDKIERGRRRLGWHYDKEAGSWVGEQRHGERMTGLGAGYAALSLRDFKKSTSINPLPPINYWRALACIVNTPPQEATPTHFIVLKALVELNVPRFIGFFGQAAIVALRKAIIEFPKNAPKSVAASAMTTLVPTLKRDAHLTLET